MLHRLSKAAPRKTNTFGLQTMSNIKIYPQLETIYKELDQLSKGDEEMNAVYPMYIHSNIVKLDRLIKEQEKLPDQDGDLVTGHLDDLIEIRWDLEHIKFRSNLLILREILEMFDKVVYFDGGE
jgi:hypothetical protein